MEREGIERDVDRAKDEMESQRSEMETRSDEMSDRVEEARHEWHARRSDSQVPGAVPPDDEPGPEAQLEPEDEPPASSEGS